MSNMIDFMNPVTGRVMREDGSYINITDLLSSFTFTPDGELITSSEVSVALPDNLRKEDGHGSSETNPSFVDIGAGYSQPDALYVQWQGSQQVTVEGAVSVVTQGNNSLSVDTGLNQPTTPADTQPISDNEDGVWDYYAGTSGTVVVTGRVLTISATGSLLGGTVTINSGDAIPVNEFSAVTLEPKANLVNPTVVFTGTDGYMIEVIR